MSDVGKIGPLHPVWPTRPIDKDRDSNEREKRPPSEKDSTESEPPTDDDTDGRHVDDYA